MVVSLLVLGLILLLPFFSKKLLNDGLEPKERLLFELLFLGLALSEVMLCSILETLADISFTPLALNVASENTETLIILAMEALIAIIEEGVKILVPFLLFLKRESSFFSGEAKEQRFYAAVFTLALFFALFENIAYAIQLNQRFSQVFVFRTITSLLVHTGLSLFYPAIFFQGKKFNIGLCMVLHFLYNAASLFIPLYFILVPAILILCLGKILFFFFKTEN